MISSLQKSSLALLLLLGCAACTYNQPPAPPPAPQAVLVSPTPQIVSPGTVTVPQGTTVVKTY
jgi:hypothetical protein